MVDFRVRELNPRNLGIAKTVNDIVEVYEKLVNWLGLLAVWTTVRVKFKIHVSARTRGPADTANVFRAFWQMSTFTENKHAAKPFSDARNFYGPKDYDICQMNIPNCQLDRGFERP